MALRHKFPDGQSEYTPPYLGVNLRDSYKDLRPGESPLMQNCLYDGGTHMRTGSSYLNQTSLGAFQIRGGIKFYRQDTTSQRLVAYSTKISAIADTGIETVLTSGQTSDLNTIFTPWSMTDRCYAANGTDTLSYVDNTGTFAVVSGTNIPTPKMVLPFQDRLLGITNNGIERTNARVDTSWSSNSSWATLRPSLSGRFTAIHPYSYTTIGTTGSSITSAALAFQSNAYYVVTGTNLGTDVTAVSASTGEDSAIRLGDARVGTSSPYSLVTVPGVGIFWFTTDLNVYWIPANAPTGRYIGDKLRSQHGVIGLESVNLNALNQVWMVYFDRKLILGIPTGNTTYPTYQYWMDLRRFADHPEWGPVWYGPMVGQTIGRAWPEIQSGDNQLIGGEGNSATGAYLYKMLQSGLYTDSIGTTPTTYTHSYQTYYKTFGKADLDKYIRSISLDSNAFSGTTTIDVYDLSEKIIGTVSVTANVSSRTCQTLVKVSYATSGVTYGNGDTYADYESAYAGFMAAIDRSCGQYISVRVNHTGSFLRVDALRVNGNLRKREQ